MDNQISLPVSCKIWTKFSIFFHQTYTNLPYLKSTNENKVIHVISSFHRGVIMVFSLNSGFWLFFRLLGTPYPHDQVQNSILLQYLVSNCRLFALLLCLKNAQRLNIQSNEKTIPSFNKVPHKFNLVFPFSVSLDYMISFSYICPV